MQAGINESASFLKPLINGLFEEGSYFVKKPCYDTTDINFNTPKKCMRGSPWVSKA